MIRSIALWLFGRPAIELSWTGGNDQASNPAPDDEAPKGLSYACGFCDEVLIDGLKQPLTRKDATDLISLHDCPTKGDPDPP